MDTYRTLFLFAQDEDGAAASDAAAMVERKADWLIALAEKHGPSVLGALALLIAAWIVSAWVAALVRRGMNRAGVDLTLTRFLGKLVGWTIKIVAIVSALGIFGVGQTSFAALLGGAGLAVGLAFQGTLGSFAAGVMLLVFRPFSVGDVVSTSGITAKVFEVGIFATTFDTPDNRRFIVPNGAIFGSTIENVTFHPQRRVDVAVGVDYSADIDRTREVLSDASRGIEGALGDPEPVVVLTGLGASSVDWVIRIWADKGDFAAVKERLLRSVKYSLDDAGIGMPYPQMDVHLDHRRAGE